MAPSEFWGLSLAEFVAVYEASRENMRVGNVNQKQVDNMIELQELIDSGIDPVTALREVSKWH